MSARDWTHPPEMTDMDRARCLEASYEACRQHTELGGMATASTLAAAKQARDDLWVRVRPALRAADATKRGLSREDLDMAVAEICDLYNDPSATQATMIEALAERLGVEINEEGR